MTCDLNGKIINPCLTGTSIPSITLGVNEFLENLKDVNLADLQDEDILMYDSDLQKWKNYDYLSLKTTDDLTEGITNLYDKDVILNAGTGIGISGSYPEFTISNTQVSAVWGNITGTLTDQIDLKNALNLKYNSSNFNTDWDSRLATKTTDNLTEGSNKYDKTVALTAGDGIQVTGTYPNFTITNVSEGNTDHSELDNLAYANSGHTGFQPAGNYLTSESDPIFNSSQAKNITQTDITNLSNLSGTNSGDQESSDFDIKDLTDSTNLRNSWTGKQDALTAGTNINITNNTISATDTTYSSGDFNLSSLGDVDDTDKAEGKILQVDSLGKHVYVTNAGGSDEKVKYDSNDTTAGYLSEKILAGTGISLSEGTGTDENKLIITNTGGGSTYTAGSGIDINENVISNTGVLTESDPVWTSEKGNYQATSEKGQNNGYASLDAGGKVPVSELPNSIIEYKGTWNASNNTPTLIDGTGNAGDVYIVSVAGTQNLGSGNISFLEGDWVMYNGTIWQKSINSNAVVSVNTQTGVVTLDADDIDDTSTTNKFVTSTDITNLGNLSGTNSGDQESSDFSLAGLSDVDDTAKATGKILQVNADGDHEYVDLPDPDVSGLVPYTGATGDVTLGNYDLTLTDLNSTGNIILSNNKYLQAVDVAGTGKIDILKVNTSDEVEAGSKFNFGLLEFAPRTEPISPDIDGLYLYEVASGTTPAREIKLVAKNHLGEEIIAFTSIV